MAALKRISGIVLCVFAILLMSHNTSALSFGATDTRSYSVSGSGAYLTNNEGTSYLLYGGTGGSNLVYIDQGAINIGIPTNTQRINGFKLGFQTNLPNKYILNVAYRFCPTNPDQLKSWIGFSTDAYNSIIDQEWIVNGSCINGSLSVFGATVRNTINLGSNAGGLNTGIMTAGGSMIFNRVNLIVLSDDADYSTVLNAIKNNTDDIKDLLDEIKDSANDALDREESETQDAADDSSTAGASSSSDATTATASLISVIGSFVNVLTTAQPTNCKINANLNHIDMGQLDLCANPVPSYVQIIGSIILICAAIPLAIVLFNRFIGLFRSFQG